MPQAQPQSPSRQEYLRELIRSMPKGTPPAPVAIDPRTQTEVHPDVVGGYATFPPGPAWIITVI